MISTYISLISSVVGWIGLNRVDRTTLIRVWAPRATDSVEGRETPAGAISMAASSREGMAPAPVMNSCWSAW